MTTDMSDGTSTTDVARDEASRVATSAGAKAGDVAQTAVTQAKEVASEAASQAKNLVQELRSQVDEQATGQRDRLVETLRSLGDELDAMVRGEGGQSGMASDLVSQVAERAQGAAGYLESREPADVLNDLKSYARRRPGAFLVGAAVAGLIAGRLTRGAKAASSSADSGSDTYDTPAPLYTAPATTYATSPIIDPIEHVGTEPDLAWSTSTSTSGALAPDSLDDASTTTPYADGPRP